MKFKKLDFINFLLIGSIIFLPYIPKIQLFLLFNDNITKILSLLIIFFISFENTLLALLLLILIFQILSTTTSNTNIEDFKNYYK